MSYQYVVLSDTNNIVDYIYSTSKYRYIRGASLILDDLNRRVTKEVTKNHYGELLSADGGEARALFNSEKDANNYCLDLQKAYLEATDEVTVTTAIIERHENEKMHEWLLRAEKGLRKAELEYGKKQMAGIPMAPIMKRCEACYKKPAERYEKIVGEEQYVCKSCYLKHQKVVELKKTLDHLENSESVPNESGLLEIHERLINETKSNKWISKIADLISADTSKDSFIGFIYADGKNIGSLFRNSIYENKNLQNQSDEEFIKQFKKISDGLHDCMIGAAIETAIKYEQENCQVDYAMIGGDDFAAIISGKYAVSYTNDLIKAFSKQTEEHPDLKEYGAQKLAAGVVIAKSSYPIYRLFSMSYELMDRTKPLHEDSCLDFHIVTDSTVQSIGHTRTVNQSTLTGKHLQHRFIRAEGYLIEEKEGHVTLDQLLKTITGLKLNGFPRSKIKAIYELLTEENDKMVEYKWLIWRTRLSKKVKRVLDEWHPNFAKTPFPFQKESLLKLSGKQEGANPYYSPLLDLFDLYDFITVKTEEIAEKEEDHE